VSLDGKRRVSVMGFGCLSVGGVTGMREEGVSQHRLKMIPFKDYSFNNDEKLYPLFSHPSHASNT
jgi:hypothetical protein